MIAMLSEKLYEGLFPQVVEGNLFDFWLATQYDENGKDIQEFIKFSDRREVFFFILEHLLRDGRIKLYKNGIFLETSIEDQIKLFRQAFPKNETDADRICTLPGKKAPYEGFGMNVWWYLDKCPVGVAWRQDDGHYEIAD